MIVFIQEDTENIESILFLLKSALYENNIKK